MLLRKFAGAHRCEHVRIISKMGLQDDLRSRHFQSLGAAFGQQGAEFQFRRFCAQGCIPGWTSRRTCRPSTPERCPQIPGPPAPASATLFVAYLYEETFVLRLWTTLDPSRANHTYR